MSSFSRGTRIWLGIAAAALVLFVVACGGAETDSAPSPSVVEPSPATSTSTSVPSPTFITPTTIPTPLADTVTVQVAEHGDLGAILVDGNSRTLYLRTEDERNQSNCDESCIKTWPPLLTIGDAEAGEGVTVEVLKNIRRDDGSNQVTFNG